MFTGFQSQDAVVTQTGRAAPDHHITMFQQNTRGAVVALESTKLKHNGQPQGHRHNGPGKVFFILILMQSHFGPWLIAINQAGIRVKAGKPRFLGRLAGQ